MNHHESLFLDAIFHYFSEEHARVSPLPYYTSITELYGSLNYMDH